MGIFGKSSKGTKSPRERGRLDRKRGVYNPPDGKGFGPDLSRAAGTNTKADKEYNRARRGR